MTTDPAGARDFAVEVCRALALAGDPRARRWATGLHEVAVALPRGHVSATQGLLAHCSPTTRSGPRLARHGRPPSAICGTTPPIANSGMPQPPCSHTARHAGGTTPTCCPCSVTHRHRRVVGSRRRHRDPSRRANPAAAQETSHPRCWLRARGADRSATTCGCAARRSSASSPARWSHRCRTPSRRRSTRTWRRTPEVSARHTGSSLDPQGDRLGAAPTGLHRPAVDPRLRGGPPGSDGGLDPQRRSSTWIERLPRTPVTTTVTSDGRRVRGTPTATAGLWEYPDQRATPRIVFRAPDRGADVGCRGPAQRWRRAGERRQRGWRPGEPGGGRRGDLPSQHREIPVPWRCRPPHPHRGAPLPARRHRDRRPSGARRPRGTRRGQRRAAHDGRGSRLPGPWHHGPRRPPGRRRIARWGGRRRHRRDLAGHRRSGCSAAWSSPSSPPLCRAFECLAGGPTKPSPICASPPPGCPACRHPRHDRGPAACG